MTAEKTVLSIVVNGTTTLVERNDNAPLKSVIEEALEQTGNVGQPMENWELRDPNGNLLDPSQKIGSFDFPEDVTLFLSLKAGVAGEHSSG